MRVIVAKPTGMCFGVERAFKNALELAESEGYALGPVVHNKQVLDLLAKRGLQCVPQEQIPDQASVLIRAHGAGPEIYSQARDRGWKLTDATCPYVLLLQDKVRSALDLGLQVVLVGDSKHPEVEAVQSHAQNRLIIVKSPPELDKIVLNSKVAVAAQTTTPPVSWQRVIEYIRRQGKEVVPLETICAATEERQQVTYELAAQVDIMVIVGGNNSANTRNLTDISSKYGTPTHQVETSEQLIPAWFCNANTAGVVAGASTPEWIIEEVVVAMENIKPKKSRKKEEEAVVEQPQATEEVVATEQPCCGSEEEVVAEQPCCCGSEEEVAVAIEECSGEDTDASEKSPEEKVPAPEEQDAEETAAPEESPAAPESSTEVVSAEATESDHAEEATQPEDGPAFNVKRGQLVEGSVVSIEEDGVYVNIGQKSDAYIARNELSNDPAAVTADLCQVGDTIEAIVLRIDNKEDKIFLSRRRAKEEQGMKAIAVAREEDKILQGKVIEAVKGGVMVELLGVRAFMPASHVDLRYVPDLTAYVGQTVSVVIKEIEEQRRRVVVSRKEALERKTEQIKADMWDTLVEGELRDGVVQRLTDFGAFVDLGGLDGLVHVSEISWARVNHPSEVLAEGQTVQVKVLGLDKEKGRISLSLKQAEGDPWRKVNTQFSAGQVVDGKVVRTASFGAFVEIAPGIEGLVHISQLSFDRVERTEDAVNPGDEVKVKILSISPEDHRVSLSIKETMDRPANLDREDNNSRPERGGGDRRPPRGGGGRHQGYSEESKVTLGDMFGELLKEKK